MEDKQNKDCNSPASQGWGLRERFWPCGTFVFMRRLGVFISPSYGSSASNKDFTALLSSAVETNRDGHTKKQKKKSLLLGLSQLSCFPPPLENVCLDYWKHRSRTNRSTPWDGTSPDVTGSCAARYRTKGDWSPILSDLCPSFERHLAVASYVSIASFLPHKVKIFFFFFLNKVFSVRKMWLNQKIQHLQERDEL